MRPLLTAITTCIFTACIAPVTGQPVNGLAAYWPMNGNFTDNGPNNISVANTGSTATTDFSGAANSAMNFVNSGSNATQYASQAVNSNVNFSGNSDFTFDYLLYYTSPTATGGIYDNNLNYNGTGMFIWHFNGFLQLQFNYKNNSVGTTNGALFLDTWTHITCTRTAGVLRVYINGVLNATANEGTQTPSYSYAAKFGTSWFNASPYFNYNGFNGKLDEFRIYNRALSQGEISELQCLHFSSAAPVITPNSDTSFCEGSSVTLTSSLPSGNQWYKNDVLINGATGQSFVVTEGGIYKVVNTQGACGAAADSVSITVFPKPQLGGDTTVKLFCPGNTTNLNLIFNTDGLNTEWNTPDAVNAPVGTYQLTATNSGGCTDTANVNVIVETSVWKGTVSTDWNDPANWSSGRVPAETTHVIINETALNDCVIGLTSFNPVVASVQVKNGGVLRAVNNCIVLLSGRCSSLPGN